MQQILNLSEQRAAAEGRILGVKAGQAGSHLLEKGAVCYTKGSTLFYRTTRLGNAPQHLQDEHRRVLGVGSTSDESNS